ncbi:albusnodin family lasso peptide [Microtetraspora malaysiensis]
MDMQRPTAMPTPADDDEMLVSLGDVTALTQGQGKGSSEDKRRAYN